VVSPSNNEKVSPQLAEMKSAFTNQGATMKPMNDYECTATSGGESPTGGDDWTSEPIDPIRLEPYPVFPPRDVIDPVPYLPDQAY
jgi:hypothetical protein